MKTVSCKYLNDAGFGRVYSFMTPVDDVKVGDRMVVKASPGLGLVEVVGVDAAISRKATRWAFQRVDETSLSGLEAMKARMDALESALRAKEESFDRESRYRIMAESDPEVGALLKELYELKKAL